MFKKIYKFFFSMPFAAILMIVLAASMAIGTFIENDYGTMTVQKVIYKTWWFELLWFLFAVSLIANIFTFRLYRKVKYGILIFHVAMIIIILGAAVTRYISYEGLMPIREGEFSNEILSDETYIQAKILGSDKSFIDKKVLFGSMGSNSFDETLDYNGKSFKVTLQKFYPNANETLDRDVENGKPILYLVHGTSMGRVGGFLKYEEQLKFNDVRIGFNLPDSSNVRVFYKNDSLFVNSDFPVSVMYMSDQSRDTLAANIDHPFTTGVLYVFNKESVVLKEFVPKGELKPFSKSNKIEAASYNALEMNISDGKTIKTLYIWGNKGMVGQEQIVSFDDTRIKLSYGSKKIQIPFKIKLRDFQLERYPGSMSPSSYASEVTLIDEKENIKKDYRIYMNHVLDYKGFRFFQSSYDKDEKGTILSANHDVWGTWLTYLGYFLLTLGMILTFFTPKARVKKLNRLISKYRDKRISVGIIILISILGSISLNAQTELPDTFKIIDQEQAIKFGQIKIQERGGRIMPMNTLSGELIRKITQKKNFVGQSSDQVMLGLMTFPYQWQDVPMIIVKNPGLKKYLGVEKYASYSDMFNEKDGYVLSKQIETALQKAAKERSKFDNEVIKVDERLNILYMIFSGNFLRIFPQENDASRKWYTPKEAAKMEFGDAGVLVKNFLPWYLQSVVEGVKENKWENADLALEGLGNYQLSLAKDYMPSEQKIDAELTYNKYLIFNKLIGWYFMIGFILLILLLIKVFKPTINLKWPIKIGVILIILGFLAHTFGLGLRWYIAGHAPWSNGYESMVYIAWAIVLAGVLLAKKSPITLAATAVLSGWILIVAVMNWLDPQITNLVPVLKSYWLMIHVSIITASYGFLFLGAMLGLISMILIIIRGNAKQNNNITYTLKELTAVNELSLTIGIFLLSIGTFLGGIWANESWGRYWGWDAKETWSLISILVYSFVLHMRKIKGLQSLFVYNLASIFASFSILMTFFGVNFYLSGLHSYAQGDPVPVPTWVFIAIFSLVLLSTIAYYRHDEKEKL